MEKPSSFYIVASFIATYLIWGSTYMFNKVVVAHIPPFTLSGYRFFISSLLVFVISFLLRKPQKITSKQLLNTFIIGFLFLTVGNGAVVYALQYVDSGFTALLISAQPLIIILLMLAINRQKVKLLSWIGVVLGMLGIYLLVNQDGLEVREGYVTGIVLIFVALLAWGYGSLLVKNADLPKNQFLNTGYQMLFGGTMLIAMSIVFGEPAVDVATLPMNIYYSMAFLVVFGGIIAFTAFNYLLKHVSPEKVATSTYVNPIVAMTLGWWVLNEQITTQSLVAAAILLLGVYFINTNRTWKRRRKIP